MSGIPHTIETTRLVLRPWRLDDVDAFHAYASEPDWIRYLPLPAPFTRRHAEEYVARRILAPWEEKASWAIEHAGALIGGIGLDCFLQGRIGELGYTIAPARWGNGFATEAAKAVIDAAFGGEPGLARIRAWSDSRNHASHRVLEKLGMTREGVLRGNSYTRGEAVDEAWFGILREEWRGSEEPRA